MLNEPFMRAVAAERTREREALVRARLLRGAAPASARRRVCRPRIHTPWRSWPWLSWRRALKRRERRPAVPEPIPVLRRVRDDVFAP